MNIQHARTMLAHLESTVVPLNPRAVVGNNNPPGPIDTARGVYTALAAFLKDCPVIQSHDEAKKAANFIEQARATLGEMEDERKRLVDPLNAELEIINGRYRMPRDSIKGLMDEVKRRATAFARAEEAKREAEAEEKRRIAEEAERVAREAEATEADAKASADVGECDVSVAAAITQADMAFNAFKKAGREAARAEKQIPVRLAGGFGRAVTMRKAETLVIDDVSRAILAIGITDKIKDAILSSARDYRKLNGSLPAGVSAVVERQF